MHSITKPPTSNSLDKQSSELSTNTSSLYRQHADIHAVDVSMLSDDLIALEQALQSVTESQAYLESLAKKLAEQHKLPLTYSNFAKSTVNPYPLIEHLVRKLKALKGLKI